MGYIRKNASRRWKRLKRRYGRAEGVDSLILVRCTGGSGAQLELLQKGRQRDGGWVSRLSCPAFIGRCGYGKIQEGDEKTPVGTFTPTEAFGIKEDPGCHALPYTKLEWYHYWSGEQATYNKMVDVRTLGREEMEGEHLISFVPHYHYALDMGYNRACTYLKGSALFLHCFGSKPYTGGCVAVSEENMREILQKLDGGIRICIYPA